MAKAKADKPRVGLPTGQELAESGYHGFNQDVGPAVEDYKPSVLGGPGPDQVSPDVAPQETKPAKKRRKK